VLFEKLKLLLKQPELCERFGKQARDTVTADYNLADNCRLLAEIFKAELENK